METEQSFPDGDKIIRLSEISNMSTNYLLKGVESDLIDIYSSHDFKSGADMSAEVAEILDHVHGMSTSKRLSIGIAILLVIHYHNVSYMVSLIKISFLFIKHLQELKKIKVYKCFMICTFLSLFN